MNDNIRKNILTGLITRDNAHNGYYEKLGLSKLINDALRISNVSVLNKIRNAGAIFLGDYTPVALGDYTAGPSHVLPTGGSGRFFSCLSVKDFLKEIHIISYTKKALQEEALVLEKIAALEGMKKHIESVKKRLSG